MIGIINHYVSLITYGFSLVPIPPGIILTSDFRDKEGRTPNVLDAVLPPRKPKELKNQTRELGLPKEYGDIVQ